MKQRIQKVLAGAGVASRRKIEEMVLQGRVSVNGRTVRGLPVLVEPGVDKIDVDGERIKIEGPRVERRAYFVVNKPKGVYSTNVAQGAQVRVIDLLPERLGVRLYPVGRLDAESKGLVLLTNDGELTNQLTHPKFGVSKTYRASVDGYIHPQAIEKFEKATWGSEKRGRGHVKVIKRLHDKSILEITLREGRNAEVRKTLAKLGHKVKELVRVRMGPLSIEGLKPGQFRELSGREVKQLKQWDGRAGWGRGSQWRNRGSIKSVGPFLCALGIAAWIRCWQRRAALSPARGWFR